MNISKYGIAPFLVIVAAFAIGLGCQNSSTTASNVGSKAPAGADATTNSSASSGTPAAPAAAAPTDDAPRIQLADAKAAYDAGNVIFVDTRAQDGYKMEHIKGAINVTQGDLDAKISSLPKGKKIIAYCS